MVRPTRTLLVAAVLGLGPTACGSSPGPIAFDDTLAPRPTPGVDDLTVPPSRVRGVATSSPSDLAPSPPPESSAIDGTSAPVVSSVEPAVTRSDPEAPTTTVRSSGSSNLFPYPTLYDVPQLGDDPVRGSGCGLAGGFGNGLPDGTWYGVISRASRASVLDFDVACAYFGESALRAGAAPGLQELFFPVNSSDRVRPVELAEDFAWRAGDDGPGGCVDPGPVADQPAATLPSDAVAWIVVSGGRAVLAVTFCG